jgi:chemotaxis protein CheX
MNPSCSPEALFDCLAGALVDSHAAICGGAPRRAAKGDADRDETGLLVGVLSLVGDVCLTMMLALPRGTALSIGRKFIGGGLDADAGELQDLVGELVNIVAGDAAARLESLGLAVQLSLPAVIEGEGLAQGRPGSLRSRELAFTSDEGPFWLTVLLSAGDAAGPGCRE